MLLVIAGLSVVFLASFGNGMCNHAFCTIQATSFPPGFSAGTNSRPHVASRTQVFQGYSRAKTMQPVSDAIHMVGTNYRQALPSDLPLRIDASPSVTAMRMERARKCFIPVVLCTIVVFILLFGRRKTSDTPDPLSLPCHTISGNPNVNRNIHGTRWCISTTTGLIGEQNACIDDSKGVCKCASFEGLVFDFPHLTPYMLAPLHATKCLVFWYPFHAASYASLSMHQPPKRQPNYSWDGLLRVRSRPCPCGGREGGGGVCARGWPAVSRANRSREGG